MPANLHLLSITRRGNSWGENFEHVGILVKFRFGRRMRPVNQGFGKILLLEQPNRASVKREVLGWEAGRPLDLRKRMNGSTEPVGIGMNGEVQRTGKKHRKVHSQILKKRNLHGQSSFWKARIPGLPRGNAMTLGYDCLGGGMESLSQKNSAIKGKST